MSRFAGLALLPRVCASQTDVKYQEIYEAVSLEFLWRLLVPLRDPRFIASIDSTEHVQKQLLGVTIALSVISLLSRDRAVAQDPDLVELIPSLIRLIRSPSLASACGRLDDERFAVSYPAEAHKDALELLWNLCTYADEGLTVARQSHSISSVCMWIKKNFMRQSASLLQCAMSLLFAMLEPFLSQSVDAHDQPKSGKTGIGNDTSVLNEIHAAVSGIAVVCAADCSNLPCASICQDPSISQSLQHLNSSNVEKMTREDAQSFQLKCFCILAATIPCLAWAASEAEAYTMMEFSWAEDLKKAALRALRSRLPMHHLLHVLSALHALSDLQGVHALLMKRDGHDQCDHGVTSLITTMVQVLKVQVYSHLQGCVLHVHAAGDVSMLPDRLHVSEAVFTISQRLLHKAVDLMMMIEDVNEGSDEMSGMDSKARNAALLDAKSEAGFVQVLNALEDSVLSMLDFVAFIAGDSRDDGPEPQQIPKGFRPLPATDEAEAFTMKIDDHVAHARVNSAQRKLSAFSIQPVQGTVEADWGWELRTMQACCHSVGMLISLAGGVAVCKKLLTILPDLCVWIGVSCVAKGDADPSETKTKLLAPIEALTPALYSIYNLKVNGGTLSESCAVTLQHPNVFTLLGCCCVAAINGLCQQSMPLIWHATLVSESVVACELIASALRKLSKSDLLTVEQLYAQLGRHTVSLPANGLLLDIAIVGDELLGALAAAIPTHMTSVVDSSEAASAVIDAVGNVATLVSTAISIMEPHSNKVGLLPALRSTCGAFWLMLEVVLTVALGRYNISVQILVSAGQEESTSWQCAMEHLLLPGLHDKINIEDVADRCCDICGNICTTLEAVPSLVGKSCEESWIGAYLQSDADFEQICTVLEQTGSLASLGHALRLLALQIRSYSV